MGITDHSIHPLERNGTTQRERLLKALIPGSLVLDDRNMADLLAFSGAYAKQIRFWDAGNQAAGDWACFWTADATSLLAMIAATDLDQYRIGYRHGELAFIRACNPVSSPNSLSRIAQQPDASAAPDSASRSRDTS